MELRHLRYFVTVAETLNFTKAAAKLHLAQPSLTRQIHNLEAELEVRLLTRSKSQVALTEEGRAFLADARRILALARESILAVQRLSRGETGQLNIAYLSNFDFELLPETLRAFRQACPHIALNLFDLTPAEQLRALEARRIDLGFIGLRPVAIAGSLQWESIARPRTVVVLPAQHPLARKRLVQLTELETLFFVGLSEKAHPGFRDWLNSTCQQAGFTPRVLQDAELESALMTFVAEGLGVALAREHIKKVPHPGVVLRPLAPPIRSEYCIAWNRNNDSRALQEYIEIVKGLVAHAH
ncbi:MAG TPA: LysR substrate-binding domain-containing protein [Candidatus Sulfotelmatobacter sp.]|nr:LysR substrate-binding domain-containing protein [Candidatus Sulfotelmatobacter sp.]HWI56529.1 LysR substrate-binding domain-containing protein [Bacillota bacterium]